MITMLKRTALSALFGLAIASSGCTADEAISPAAADAEGITTNSLLTLSTTTRLVKVKDDATISTTVAEVTIDRSGGNVKVGGHMLNVPKDAVAVPTIFRMELKKNTSTDGTGPLWVDLSARGALSGLPVATFTKPLGLKLDWARIAETVDPSRMSVVWLVDGTEDGLKEKQPTVVDPTSKWIKADLTHFSPYALGVD